MSSYARAARRQAVREEVARSGFVQRWGAMFFVAAAVLLIGVMAAVSGGDGGDTSPGGEGVPAVGEPAPDFSALDVVSGKELTLDDLQGRPALLFFSEGAACDACMVQAQKLAADDAFRETGIQLVSVTTDPEPILRQVAAHYAIDTPLLSDPDREMSQAYGMLGRGGMGHADTNGHAFMLIDEHGTVRWERAYSEMFVPTRELMAELGA